MKCVRARTITKALNSYPSHYDNSDYRGCRGLGILLSRLAVSGVGSGKIGLIRLYWEAQVQEWKIEDVEASSKALFAEVLLPYGLIPGELF